MPSSMACGARLNASLVELATPANSRSRRWRGDIQRLTVAVDVRMTAMCGQSRSSPNFSMRLVKVIRGRRSERPLHSSSDIRRLAARRTAAHPRPGIRRGVAVNPFLEGRSGLDRSSAAGSVRSMFELNGGKCRRPGPTGRCWPRLPARSVGLPLAPLPEWLDVTAATRGSRTRVFCLLGVGSSQGPCRTAQQARGGTWQLRLRVPCGEARE